jgi:hypothetical protein
MSDAVEAASGAGADAADMDAGAGDAASTDAAVECGSLSFNTPACTACTAQNCCGVENLCAALVECAPLNDCWTACDADATCTRACGTKYITAISNYNAVLNCQFNTCSAVCGR